MLTPTLRRNLVWPARADLVGARVPVERAMLPVLHLRVVGGGRLDAVVFCLRTDDGRTGSARLSLGMRFSRTAC